MKLLWLVKTNQYKHIRPQWGQPSFLPVLHTRISLKEKKEEKKKEGKLNIF